MPTKIRLQRYGKKRFAYFHVVVADARAPRDGKFIEKLGNYNPNDNPATIDIDFDRCLYWVKEGAQPTDTCRALLSYKGVLHKEHLDRGVKKGALTQEQADKKFATWLKDKEGKISGKSDKLAKVAAETEKTRLAAEKEVDAKKAAEILAKNTPPVAEAVEEVATPTTEETPAATTDETPVIVAEKVESITPEVAPEAKTEEALKEEIKEEVAEDKKLEE